MPAALLDWCLIQFRLKTSTAYIIISFELTKILAVNFVLGNYLQISQLR